MPDEKKKPYDLEERTYQFALDVALYVRSFQKL